jgi:AcrR family transcriptional regulator
VTSPTEERILRTFLRLVAERGIDATTTRVLAEAAGVNEVTLFRLFGDKANLAAEAFRRFAPVDALAGYALAIDASTPERALEGICEVLNFLRQGMLEHPEFVQLGMGEYWRLPQLKDQIAASPRAARDLVERALDAAEPALLPGLDRRAASLGLVGLLLVSVVWPARGWIDLSEPKWRSVLTQAVRLLLRTD